MIAVCLWCFFLGTVLGCFMLVLGFIAGVMGDGWNDFLGGALWCLGQIAPIFFSWLYRKIYGADEWLKSETFFGV